MERTGVKHLLAAMDARRTAMTEAQTGERTTQAEFEAFYLRTARTLHGYLCRLSGDSATADEVLQEAYIRMLHAPVMEDPSRKAYLYKTATNLLRDRWRKLKREQKLWEAGEYTEQVHQNLNLPVDMAFIFSRLSAQERAILWLAHVEELSHREISMVLSVKEQSVKVMVFRAREKARDLLEKAGFRGSHE
jgi:RNA polymerase sigma-70 factor, ECF subfamily